VVTVNYEFFDNQTVGSARNLVDELRSGSRPVPTRGAPLCSFRQTERQIAGFFDAETLAPDAVSSGGPTEAGIRLALDRGDTVPSYATNDGGGAVEAGAASSSEQPTSSHDAPLPTAESDASATPAGDAEAKTTPAETPKTGPAGRARKSAPKKED